MTEIEFLSEVKYHWCHVGFVWDGCMVGTLNFNAMHMKQDNGRHHTSPPLVSLSICPVNVAFASRIMGKHDVIHKTGST